MRETSAQAIELYRDLVQNLKPWHAPAPKLHTEIDDTDTATADGKIVPAWVGEDRTPPAEDLAEVAPELSPVTDGGDERASAW